MEQQRVIERLERRIAELEGQARPGDPLRMPGLKAKSGRQPPVKQLPRKQRRHGFARRRMTPTQRVEHVMENCPMRLWTQNQSRCPRPPTEPHTAMPRSTACAVSAIHRTAQRAQPAVRSWTASAPARWSTPTKPAGVRAGPTATCGPHPHRTLLPAAGSGQNSRGRGAERCFLRSIGQRILRCESVGQVGQRIHLHRPVGFQAKLCRRIERHIRELFVFVAEPDVPADNNAAERAWPPGHQSQDQRRHPLGARHTEQDDLGLSLRHLARPGSKSSRRLPSTAHLPATLNCYGIPC